MQSILLKSIVLDNTACNSEQYCSYVNVYQFLSQWAPNLMIPSLNIYICHINQIIYFKIKMLSS